MAVRVGINGFGRIGRNFFRAAKKRGRRHRLRRRQRPRVAGDDGAPAEVRLDARHAAERRSRPTKTASRSTATSCRVLVGARSEGAAVGRPRRRHGHRVDRLLHRPRQGGRAPRRRRAARHRVGAVGGRRRDLRLRRQPRRRSTRKQHKVDLERVVHDELLRPDGQGARRRVRRREGPDDDRPRLHRRPAARRRAAQGPPPRPRRGHQHHPDEHRRRPGDEPRARVDEGQARRHRRCGCPCRPARSPTSPPSSRPAASPSTRSTRRSRRRRRRAR